MAIPAQGLTVSWGGTALLEVQEISIDQERGLPLERKGTWTLNLGTVRIAGFSTYGLSESEYGRRKVLVLEGRTATSGAVIKWFERDCILQDRRISAAPNDVLRFDHVFRIMDTVNANQSHP